MAIESATTVLSGIKYLSDLVKTVKDAEIKIAMNNAILELQDQLFQLQEENRELREEVAQLKSAKTLRSGVEKRYKHPIVTHEDESHKVANCGSCWGSDEGLMPLGKRYWNLESVTYNCGRSNCNNEFVLGREQNIFEKA